MLRAISDTDTDNLTQVMMGGRKDSVASEEEEEDGEHGVDSTEDVSKVREGKHDHPVPTSRRGVHRVIVYTTRPG